MSELMKIKTIYAEPGMIIGKDIYSSTDYLIAGEGTALTDRMISRLKFYSVEEIDIVTPDFLREKEQPVIPKKQAPVAGESYVNKVKASPEYKVFTETFSTSYTSCKERFTNAIENNAPLNPDEMLADVTKIFTSCKNPSGLLDLMMTIRNLDDATYVHSVNVALICNLFAHWLKFNEKETRNLTLAGLLHDIGKLMIPAEIMQKPGKLTAEEYKVIQEHPLLGYNVLKNQGVNYHVCMAALMHHERCDGSGYPRGLTLNQIDPYAKIVAIADVYDALTSARTYREPLSPLEVIGVFQTEGLRSYDPKYLMVFLDQIMYTYMNYTVQLSNGETGRIVMMQKNHLDKPVIALSGNRFIDLREEKEITITGII